MVAQNHRFREEVINVQLANILAAQGLDANAETIVGGGRPDVLINLDGLKLVLEGRTVVSKKDLMRDADRRVQDGLADISMALVYPEDLKTAATMSDLTRKIESARYDGAIFYLNSKGVATLPFYSSALAELVETINDVFRLRVQNEVVRDQVTGLRDTIEGVVEQASATNLLFDSDVLASRLKEALGVGSGDEDESPEES
jgi:hypothetical protein